MLESLSPPVSFSRPLKSHRDIFGFEHNQMLLSAFRSQYWSGGIFIASFSLFLALLFALYYFFLPAMRFDFLEKNWLAQSQTTIKEPIAVIAALYVCAISSFVRDQISDYFFLLLSAFPVIPMIVVFFYRGAHLEYLAFIIAMHSMIFLLVRIPYPNAKRWRFSLVSNGSIVYLAILLTSIFIIAALASGNLEFLNFDFDEIYQFRALASESRGVALEYVMTTLTGFLLPLSIAICLTENRKVSLIILIIGILVIFGLTSHRAHIFVPLFVVSIYYALSYRKHGSIYIIAGLSALVIFATLMYMFFNEQMSSLLITRRMFFVPAYANYLYFDFFSFAPKMDWSDNQIGALFFHNPYGTVAPRVVMNYYYAGIFGQPDVYYGNADAGFYGSGYAQAGYVGIFIYSVILGLFLRSTDVLQQKMPFAMLGAAMSHLFVTIIFTSTNLLTSFLSYGMIWYFLLIYLYTPPQWFETRKQRIASQRSV